MKKIFLIICIALLTAVSGPGAAFAESAIYGSSKEAQTINDSAQQSTFQAASYAPAPSSELIKVNEYTNQYKNYALGYEMQMFGNMKIDESAMDVRTRFSDQSMTVDIYYDDFTGSLDSFSTYKNYGNKSLYSNPYYNVTSSSTINVDGKSSHIIYYQREKLSKVKDDKNYYACVEIPRTSKEVYTIIVKSSQPIENFRDLIGTFSFKPKSAPVVISEKRDPSDRVLGEKAQRFMKDHFSDESSLSFGVFEPTAPYDFAYMDQLENMMGYEFPVIVRYQHMNENFPMNEMLSAKMKNKVVELTMQTTELEGSDKDITFEILNGSYDEYFSSYAQDIKNLDHPVLFRLNNEMNGDWCQYSAYHYGKDADLYTELYRYIFEIFQANQADNVIFVWNPNERSYPDFSWNHYMAYYPGDEYVDIVGLTGYNNGNYYSGEKWRSFEQIYDPLYQDYDNRFNHPLMITEFGSSSFGGDKAYWIDDMFTKISKYPRIKSAVWWSGTDWDSKGNPARIYKIDQDESVIRSVRNGLSRFTR